MQSIQQKIKEYLAERKWDKNEPIDLSKSIIIEGAELMELFQWHNPKRAQILKDRALIEKIRGELADVLIYSYGMAITLGLNAEEVIEAKLNQVKTKYPAKEVLKGRKQYLKIKQEYRRKNA